MKIFKNLLQITLYCLFAFSILFLLNQYFSDKVIITKEMYNFLVEIYYNYKTRTCI